MKIIKIVILSISLFFTSYFFVSCKKSKVDLFTTEYQNIMRENALSQAFVDDILKVSENILLNNGNAKIETTGAPLGCITNIDTLVTGANSKTYTITFDGGCTGYDGKSRIGTMKVELEGTNYNNIGSSVTIHFSDFYINYNQWQGKIISTNMGSGIFKVVVSDEAGTGYASLTLTAFSKTTLWKSTHKRTIIEGATTPAILIDNKYLLGIYDADHYAFEGVSTDNIKYYGNPSTDLLLDYSCVASGNLRYPTDGEVDIRLGNEIRQVDYGDGLCDYTVKMISGDTYTEYSLY